MRVKRDDRGVTLVEVLVAIVLLGIIAVPLGNALVMFFMHSEDTNRRMSESHDAQTAAAYFAQDVQSIGTRDWINPPYAMKRSVERMPPADTGDYPCLYPGDPDPLVRFAWDDPTDATTTPRIVRVAYVVKTVNGERQLHRLVCIGSNVPTVDVVLAHNVSTTDPTVACAPVADCTGTNLPQSVTLTLTVQSKPPSKLDPYPVVLFGQRRQT